MKHKEKIITIVIVLICIYYSIKFHEIGCLEKLKSVPVLDLPKQQEVNDISQMDPKTKAYLYVSFLIISVYLITRAF